MPVLTHSFKWFALSDICFLYKYHKINGFAKENMAWKRVSSDLIEEEGGSEMKIHCDLKYIWAKGTEINWLIF